MSGTDDFYRATLLDHNRNPRNHGTLDPCTHHAHGDNPMCGDEVTITVNVENGIVRDIRFEGAGCAISIASASMLTECLVGVPVREVPGLLSALEGYLGDSDTQDPCDTLNEFSVFAGVRDHPSRLTCVTLPWMTLAASLEGVDEVIIGDGPRR